NLSRNPACYWLGQNVIHVLLRGKSIYTVKPIMHILRSGLDSLVVRSDALGAWSSNDVGVAALVDEALLGTASDSLLGLLLLLHLWGLVLHLTSTSKGTVNLSATSEAEHQVQGALLLDIVVTAG